MLEDIRKIIRAGGYDLADLLHRIDVLYAAGRLSDVEREGVSGWKSTALTTRPTRGR